MFDYVTTSAPFYPSPGQPQLSASTGGRVAIAYTRPFGTATEAVWTPFVPQ